MSSRTLAPIEPDLLIWARKSINYDIRGASRKIGVSEEKLTSWESGQAQPTVAQLRKIANVYKRPLAVFFLPKPPNEYEPAFTVPMLRDFRRLPEKRKHTVSPALSLELRKAKERRQNLIDIYIEQEIPIPQFNLRVSRSQSLELQAQRIRKLLNVSVQDQHNWPTSHYAFRQWVQSTEKLGILVFQTGIFQGDGVEIEEMRGIAVSLAQFPVILLNGKDAVSARIFTLFHELCHLLLNVSGISGTGTFLKPRTEDEALEVYCNHFAAELLVPRQALLSSESIKRNRSEADWDDDQIEGLASAFKVSCEVIVRRLQTLNIVSLEFYQRKRKQYLEESRKEKSSGKKTGAPARDRLLTKWHGEAYISTIIEAYRNNTISFNDLHDYIGAKTPQIEKLLTKF